MNEVALRSLLDAVRAGDTSVETAMSSLRELPFKDLGYARVDHHRSLRLGFPEVVYGEGKTAEQIAGIVSELANHNDRVLATRVDADKAAFVIAAIPDARYLADARAIVVERAPWQDSGRGVIAIVCAGTSDLPVAAEAEITARMMGNRIDVITDVGVAGVHRLLAVRERLEAATVIVVVAGMEGALPTAVAGLVGRPVVAVPTSIGYGANFGGLSALLGMMTSCAAGVVVVNIDNGFGGGFAASLMNRG